MSKINITVEQLLEFIILGIKNGRYEPTKLLAQDYLDGLKELNKKEPGQLVWKKDDK
jgi:hypothetical protein